MKVKSSKTPRYKVDDVVTINQGYGAPDRRIKITSVSANHGGAGNHRYYGKEKSGQMWGVYEDQVLVDGDAATDAPSIDEYQTKALGGLSLDEAERRYKERDW